MTHLFDFVFEDVLSTLKFSSNVENLSDVEGASEARIELALEITKVVMEHFNNSPQIAASERFFKSCEGAIWKCDGVSVIKFEYDHNAATIVGTNETEIYETADTLKICVDVEEITQEQFKKALELMSHPF